MSVVLNLNSPCVNVGRFTVVPTGIFRAVAADIVTLPEGTVSVMPSLVVSVLITFELNLIFSNLGPPVVLPAKIKLLLPTVVVIPLKPTAWLTVQACPPAFIAEPLENTP